MGKLFFSQNFDALAASLARELASDGTRPLQKRWVLVPNGPIKQWLTLRLGSENVLAGCKITSVEEALFLDAPPTPFEMGCLIYHALSEEQPPELARFLAASPKRKGELADHLAGLFLSYRLHGSPKSGGWQSALFEKLVEKMDQGRVIRDPVHCFGFDFLPERYWESLNACPRLCVYLFSPCFHFWEDLCSDWERRNLSLFWKKKGASEGARMQLQNYLEEAPSILANWGKLGRETLKVLDRYPLEVAEAYAALPEEPSLLHALQNEIVSFERAPLPAADGSIEIFLTGSSKMNEVEVLRDEILRLQIPFSDIAVLAPDIQPYIPLIEFLFSDIPYRMSDVELFYQGMERLSALIRNTWRFDAIIELIETPTFYKHKCWDIGRCAEWAREIFQGSDWKTGFEKKIRRLATLCPGPPQKGDLLEQADDLEELLSFLQSLEADLDPLRTGSFTLSEWAMRLEALADKYLTSDPEDDAERAFRTRILELRKADERLGPVAYPFEVIDSFLNRPCSSSFRGSHLHAVRIGSIAPGAILPARAIFLIGMDEESYPRKKIRSSLDLLKNEPIYVPEKPDIDRYLLLQILLSARDFLRISYGHLSPDEGKPVGPSLLVAELLNALPSNPSRVVSKRTFDEPISRRFSIRSPSPPASEPERILSLFDLTSFARHPWKHYLRKTEGISLDANSERTFAMQRSPLLRASLKWPIDTLLSIESDLPPPLFREPFRLDLEERAAAWRARKKEWGDTLYSLSFFESAETVRRTHDRIEFPPIELELEGVGRVLLTGEVPHAMEQGVVHLGDESLPSLLKSWPELLAASTALGTTQIHCLKSGKTKTIADPKQSLKSFVIYYLRCSGSLSPLMPDWADSLLRKRSKNFDMKTEYEDPVVEWFKPRLEPPNLGEWDWLRESFAGLIELYPTRGAHEEV